MRRRIGILRVGSMGDHLIALPLYKQLKAAHPADSLILVCNLPEPGNLKLVGPASFLPARLFDEYRNYPVGSDWPAVRETYRMFRDLALDKLYYLMPQRTAAQLWRDRLFFWLAGVSVVGLRTAQSARTPRPIAGSNLVEHEADRLAGLISLKALRTTASLSLDLTDVERAEARSLAGTVSNCTVVISVGTKLEVNDWGLDKWSQLVTKLAAVRTIDRLVLIGAADESAQSDAIRECWPRESVNYCGKLTPRMSAAVLADAKLFVGHDSGPMHMAAAVGVPLVAIFSSRNLPGMWFPLSDNKRIHYTVIDCMGCGRLTCDDRQKQCIRGIEVGDVFASCVEALMT